jgi:hypothetical protein
LALAGIAVALWFWNRHRKRVTEDITFLMRECDRAAERMERAFMGRAEAS